MRLGKAPVSTSCVDSALSEHFLKDLKVISIKLSTRLSSARSVRTRTKLK